MIYCKSTALLNRGAFETPKVVFDMIIKVFEIVTKVADFCQCSKMQIISLKNLNIKTCFIQFLWFFRLKCWFKGQILSRIHLSLSNAYKLKCFGRNINGNRDVKFLSDIIGHCTEACSRP